MTESISRGLFNSRVIEGGVVVIPLAEYMAAQKEWDELTEDYEMSRQRASVLESELWSLQEQIANSGGSQNG